MGWLCVSRAVRGAGRFTVRRTRKGRWVSFTRGVSNSAKFLWRVAMSFDGWSVEFPNECLDVLMMVMMIEVFVVRGLQFPGRLTPRVGFLTLVWCLVVEQVLLDRFYNLPLNVGGFVIIAWTMVCCYSLLLSILTVRFYRPILSSLAVMASIVSCLQPAVFLVSSNWDHQMISMHTQKD